MFDPVNSIAQWLSELLAGWGLSPTWVNLVLAVIGVVVTATFVLVMDIFLVWVERKVVARFQDRLGPNRLGPFGLIQPFADIIKLLIKEDITPVGADKILFNLAPILALATVVSIWAVIPFSSTMLGADLNVGILFIVAIGAIGTLSIIMAGWASNNKYSLLGSIRASAQMLTYEVFMGLSLVGVIMTADSFNLREIVEAQRGGWFIIPQFVGFVIFFIAGLAETHRTPFDIPEAEGELVAGYHSEYSGMKFGMFFVGEYMGVTLISTLITTLFFGGWLGPAFLPPIFWFFLKTAFFIFLFILVRAALPRPRYDQLMEAGWKILLPLVLLNILITGAILLMRQ